MATIFTVFALISLLVGLANGERYKQSIMKSRLSGYAQMLVEAGSETDAVMAYFPDDVRVTIMSADGEVSYDSYGSAAEMENHFDRPEIRECLRRGEGTALRRSDTSGERYFYYAREDGGDADDYEIGDQYSKLLPLSAFGRRGILNIRQNLQGRIMDIEKANVYKKYSEKIGELFYGEVYQTWSKEVLILDEDGNELHIPKSEQIPGERFKKSDSVKAIIKSVEVRAGGARDRRRPDYSQEGRACARRAREGGGRVVR